MKAALLIAAGLAGLAGGAQAGWDLKGAVASRQAEAEGSAAPGVKVEASRALKLGSKGAEVVQLREALAKRFPELGLETTGTVFDKGLESAVKKVQRQLKLTEDGIVDAQLKNALSLSGEERAKQLSELGRLLERLEESAARAGKSEYLVVNIPSFSLKYVKSGAVEMESRVVVGRPDRQTPIGAMSIVSIKYNPDWSPPPTIMKKSVLPSLDGDRTWVKKHGLEAIDSETGEEMDVEDVSAEDVASGRIRLKQPAGEGNALGVLKFETDSKENIYLHDTNERSLFGKSNRAKSSGCIRVEKWKELAAKIGRQEEGKVAEKVASGKTFWEKVSSVPVFVIYSQADVYEDGAGFFPNIYSKTQK